MTSGVAPERVAALLDRERAAFADAHPRSHAAWLDGRKHLLGGVPMTWMLKAAGGFPVFLDRAEGARVRDIDGHDYVDFSLGDTGAMAGHSPPPVVAAVRPPLREVGGGTGEPPAHGARLGAGR